MGSNNYYIGDVAMRRIMRDDPTLTEIEIDDSDNYHDVDEWEENGRAVGKNC